MKQIKFFFLCGVAAITLGGCKKDENRVEFQGGTAPVLSASTTGPIVLSAANAANTGITFSWTNPNYRFNTGVSSQDVNYTLQIDSAGRNFSSPRLQQVLVARDLSNSFTVKDFNAVLNRMELAENVPHTLEFRLRSTLTNNSVPLNSNVLRLVVTPYLDVAVPVPPTGDLWLTGDAMPSSWTNSPPASQRMNRQSTNATLFDDTVAFVPGRQYKFLSTPGNWQPQYGGSDANGGDLGFNMGGGSDPAAIPTPAQAGNYRIVVNFRTGRYTVTRL